MAVFDPLSTHSHYNLTNGMRTFEGSSRAADADVQRDSVWWPGREFKRHDVAGQLEQHISIVQHQQPTSAASSCQET